MPKERRIIKRYSPAFKAIVVEEIAGGKFTFASAMRHYGIRGSSTIARWCVEMGREDLLPKIDYVDK